MRMSGTWWSRFAPRVIELRDEVLDPRSDRDQQALQAIAHADPDTAVFPVGVDHEYRARALVELVGEESEPQSERNRLLKIRKQLSGRTRHPIRQMPYRPVSGAIEAPDSYLLKRLRGRTLHRRRY
jgi:hypothetical protein